MSLKSTEKLEKSRVELIIDVDADSFNKAVDDSVRKNIKKITIPGFRKGKAPRSFVEKYFGREAFYDDAVNEVIPGALEDAVKESGLKTVDATPEVDIVSIDENGLTFKAIVPVYPEFTIGEYKGLTVDKVISNVTDHDIEHRLHHMREDNSRRIDIDDRAAEMGDTVTIDFDGYLDGERFDGGYAEDFELVLGSNTFIPGFEEQIVGKEINEHFDVNITFPEDYHEKKLAGKPAVFKVTVHNISKVELPELDDEFAKDVSEFDTIDELKEDIKKNLAEEQDKSNEADAYNRMIEKVVETFKGDIPDAMIEKGTDNRMSGFEQRIARDGGIDLKTYMKMTGMDEASIRGMFRKMAENDVKTRLTLEKIAETENFEVTEEEITSELQKVADAYKMEADKIRPFINEDDLRTDILVDKAVDFLKENTSFKDVDKLPEKMEAKGDVEKSGYTYTPVEEESTETDETAADAK
ncbi:MAG: trigger factor [Clostridia bacterium]|nr:trigger factor [Clostridia bacterium]